MNYSLLNSTKRRMPRKFIEQWLRSCFRSLWKQNLAQGVAAEISIVFLTVKLAKEVNFRYRKKNYATDVLSFSGDGREVLGELVLCPEIIERQAREHGLKFKQELGYLLLHGLLHLLGYDHEGSKKDAEIMFQLQDEIFDQLCRKFWK